MNQMKKIILKIIKKLRQFSFRRVSFKELSKRENIYLYAGDIPYKVEYKRYIGLSLTQSNMRHIKHNISNTYPLSDNCVDVYQSEDVFEYIEVNEIPMIINEIYRILKPNGIFRLSLPDYGCDILFERTLKSKSGDLQFDPGGGGTYKNGKVVKGHVWFPTYKTLKIVLDKTKFKNIIFYHYYDEKGESITNTIDYDQGYVMRTPDHDKRVQNPYRAMSIVVDCIKD